MFFDSIQIGGYNQRFIDGGVGCNNPIQVAYGEALDVFPNRKPFILSIGTGCAPDKSFGGHAIVSIVEAMKAIVTETERTAEAFLRAHTSLVEENLLFRFNVNQGLKEIGLEEFKETAAIATATQTYLGKYEIGRKMSLCVDKLSQLLQQGWFSFPISW